MHFKSISSFCRLCFGVWFIVLCLLSFPGHFGAGVGLSRRLRAVSFTLQLRAAWAELAVEEGAPGPLYLGGLLQTIHRLQGAQAEKSTIVVALVLCQELVEHFRRAALCQSLVSEMQRTTLLQQNIYNLNVLNRNQWYNWIGYKPFWLGHHSNIC